MYGDRGMLMVDELSAPIYNLKAVVNETDLKPSTIRAWERRYGLPRPRRTSGGHRQYSRRDIDTLFWLVARQEEGMTISHAVKLWRTLNDQAGDSLPDPGQAFSVDSVKAAVAEANTEVYKLREEWIASCLSFDRAAAEQILARAFVLFPPEVVCVQLLQAGLSQIGKLWYQGDASIQQEHFASAMSMQRLDMLIAATPPPTRPERIVIASAQDDFHVFSPLLFTFLLRRRGWEVLYLGADMPAAALEEMVAQVEPHMLIVTAQQLSTATSVLEVTDALADRNIIIGYGGAVFNLMPQLRERIPAHFLGSSIDGAVTLVESLLQRRAPNPPAASDRGFIEALGQFERRRALIESHIWRIFTIEGKATEQLAAINQELAGIIAAALIFGDGNILSSDMDWIEYLAKNYKMSENEARTYLTVYVQAAEVHLDGPAKMITGWLHEGLIG